jgi:hypothetical protein
VRVNQSSKDLNESFESSGRVCTIGWKFKGFSLKKIIITSIWFVYKIFVLRPSLRGFHINWNTLRKNTQPHLIISGFIKCFLKINVEDGRGRWGQFAATPDGVGVACEATLDGLRVAAQATRSGEREREGERSSGGWTVADEGWRWLNNCVKGLIQCFAIIHFS